ncbi:GNAT family N-acetyltransferase [Brevibacillus fluminis]|uniref:GNAT family N-acetyltransferase n=2 Tax=Brevibacillus fluminis TaxID=511487 RepID=A0A3M8DD33_9BACL|nr:GNAT family N-acetyltransferase [Brevibacillus fluminis]
MFPCWLEKQRLPYKMNQTSLFPGRFFTDASSVKGAPSVKGASGASGGFDMNMLTSDKWDEALWQQAEPIYYEAFPAHGRKKRELIERMFARNMCNLHVLMDGDEAVGMALTGKTQNEDASALLIDYFAVKAARRGERIGQRFMAMLKEWAQTLPHMDGIIVEVEAEESEMNRSRIRFWESCGFTLTDYIHTYIWVPETYKAMYVELSPESRLPKDGQHLFSFITAFHKKAYARK